MSSDWEGLVSRSTPPIRRCLPARRRREKLEVFRNGGSQSLAQPPECGGVNGCIPPARQIIIQQRDRYGTSRHIEGCDVRTYKRARYLQAFHCQKFMCGMEHQIELHHRRAAKAVDEQEDVASRQVSEIRHDG